jgi:P4 family phage/plasmid primase-like protien
MTNYSATTENAPPTLDETYEAVKEYAAAKIYCVPVDPNHGKKPKPSLGKNPLSNRFSPEDVPHMWDEGDNTGFILGKPSGDIVDIDLDHEISRWIGRQLLPRLGETLTFGRPSAPESHFLYKSPGVKNKSKAFPNTGKKFIEVRATGLQTVVPPSFHAESGERREWTGGEFDPDKIKEVDAKLLERAYKIIASASAIAHMMPPPGSRYDYALALAGYLTRENRLSKEDLEAVLTGAYAYYGTREEYMAKLRYSIESSSTKNENGKPVIGGTWLKNNGYGDLVMFLADVWEFYKKGGDKKDEGPSHLEVVSRFLKDHKDRYVYSADVIREYRDGIWVPIGTAQLNRRMLPYVEQAEREGMKVTGMTLDSVRKLILAHVAEEPDIWDKVPNILIMENGALDINTGVLHESKPEYFATLKMPYEYDPSAEAPNWTYFINYLKDKLGADVVYFMQEYAGLCLTTETRRYEMALLIVGRRGSGKSTWIEGLKAMMGPYAGTITLSRLQSEFGLAGVPGKRLLYSSEVPPLKMFETDVVDSLISGETVRINQKRVQEYDYEPVAKLIQAMNELPRITNPESGFFRRAKVIQFPPFTGVKDEGLKDRIRQEAPGVLNWALEGLWRLQERGYFDIPKAVELRTDEFIHSNDIIKTFVGEVFEPGANFVERSKVYRLYAHWCKMYGHHALGRNKFLERIGEYEMFSETIKPKGCGVGYPNLTLTDEGFQVNKDGPGLLFKTMDDAGYDGWRSQF